MRFELLTAFDVRRAVDVYLALAYPAGCGKTPRFERASLDGAKSLQALLELFEAPRKNEALCTRRYALRLGNARYPHMKLVVQEYLVAGEFFFSVDTHDNLDVKPGMPDHASFLELRTYNRALKHSIEQAWHQSGLPTYGELRALCENLSEIEHGDGRGERILVVDDEEDVALGVGALLTGQGYQVDVVHSGEAALEHLRRGPLPQLVLLDLELLGMDGRAVVSAIRSEPAWERIPVLLVTAAEIDLLSLKKLNGALRKPYGRDVLRSLIRHSLR